MNIQLPEFRVSQAEAARDGSETTLAGLLLRYRMHLSPGRDGYREIADRVTRVTAVVGEAIIDDYQYAALCAHLPCRQSDVPEHDLSDERGFQDVLGHFLILLELLSPSPEVLERYQRTRSAAACFYYELRYDHHARPNEVALLGMGSSGTCMLGRWMRDDGHSLAPLSALQGKWGRQPLPESSVDARLRPLFYARGFKLIVVR